MLVYEYLAITLLTVSNFKFSNLELTKCSGDDVFPVRLTDPAAILKNGRRGSPLADIRWLGI